MQKAIIHAQTRVVRRLTTDENPSILPDESIVSLNIDLDLKGQIKKLDVDNKTLLDPTPDEVEDSKTTAQKKRDKQITAIANLESLANSVSQDNNVPQSVINFINNLVDIF